MGEKMSDFRARLHTEFSDLTIKVDKLKDFIVSEQYDKLPEIDRKDLKEQFLHMSGYLAVLNRRVSRLCGAA